ncbi:MAG: sigma-70 family RNA polymerase sigma factor [Chloroflexi bacterium]|nr:sigma-70 family RNA polymerase sigma factor [Chloroflexota bacterium]
MPEPDEKTIIEQARQDPRAFAALYERYIDRIYGFIYRRVGDVTTTQDITSATFEQALRNISKYRWQGISFAAWLYRIARNQIVHYHRRQRFLVPMGLNNSNHLPDAEADLLAVEERNDIAFAIIQLSDKDQEVLTLRFFEDLSSQDMADVLGCSKQNAYLRLHRALKRLRKQIEQVQTEKEPSHG